MNVIKFFPTFSTSSILAFSFLLPVSAQVIPDGTTSTTVDVDGTINDGDRAGGNLFHSFQEFSVPDGGRAFFNNAADIVNIFSRVTGGNISNINGLLGANGTANLFLINPAGIIFGPNARLSIGGSFFGSTADSIVFSDGEFSALDPNNPPLLTINAPLGLGIRDNPADIVNRSTDIGLEVNAGETLALIGGNIDSEGGQITAPGANVWLGGLSAAGTVSITDNFDLSLPDGIARADISFSDGATVNTANDNGGGIIVIGNSITLSEASQLFGGIAENSGFEGAEAGDISLNATSAVNLSGESSIQNPVNGEATGKSGDINVIAQSLTLIEGSFFGASTFGIGDAGDINLQVQGDINLFGGQISSNVQELAVGQGGQITLTARSMSLSEGSSISTVTFPNGEEIETEQVSGGNIELNVTESLRITGNSTLITATTGKGNAGNITINGEGANIVFENNLSEGEDNTEPSGSIFSSSLDSIGNAGGVNITAKSLKLRNDGVISSTAFGGTGNGGDITINVAENLDLTNFTISSDSAFGVEGIIATGNAGNITINAGSFSSNDSSISSSTFGSGNAGNINIDVNSFSFSGGLGINNGTSGAGNAGDITIDADNNLEITDSSSITTETLGAGDGGGIEVTTNNLEITNGAGINASTSGEGNGGTISVTANESISLDGTTPDGLFVSGIFNTVNQGAIGNGGGIEVTTNNLEITNGANINASTSGEGNGGTISVTANESISLDGTTPDVAFASGIFNTVNQGASGNGGGIEVTTNNLEITNGATINVSSFGEGNGGNITVTADSLNLDSGSIFAAIQPPTNEELSGGNITLQVEDNLILRNNSTISAAATNNANGGNVTIGAGFVVGFPSTGTGSDIRANAELGRGGNINIQTQGVLGFEENSGTAGLLNDTNDIDASSLVEGLEGVVTINNPDVNPLQGVDRLPTNPVSADTIATEACSPRGEGTSLIYKGKGGIPPEPTAPFSADALIPDGKPITLDKETDLTSLLVEEIDPAQEDPNYIPADIKPVKTDNGDIYPARGIIKTADGKIILTAYPTPNTTSRTPEKKLGCS